MSLLRWQTGQRQDAEALRGFSCTEQPRNIRRPHGWALHHPRPWEAEVQAIIHGRLKPTGTPARTNLLGWEDDGQLGAVVSYSEDTTGGFTLDILAVAIEYRGRGGGWAAEALTTTIDFMTADASGRGLSSVIIAAVIHERNRPAQELARSHRFSQTEQRPDGLQVWTAEFPLEGYILVR